MPDTNTTMKKHDEMTRLSITLDDYPFPKNPSFTKEQDKEFIVKVQALLKRFQLDGAERNGRAHVSAHIAINKFIQKIKDGAVPYDECGVMHLYEMMVAWVVLMANRL
jgi:hypothetical protein